MISGSTHTLNIYILLILTSPIKSSGMEQYAFDRIIRWIMNKAGEMKRKPVFVDLHIQFSSFGGHTALLLPHPLERCHNLPSKHTHHSNAYKTLTKGSLSCFTEFKVYNNNTYQYTFLFYFLETPKDAPI